MDPFKVKSGYTNLPVLLTLASNLNKLLDFRAIVCCTICADTQTKLSSHLRYWKEHSVHWMGTKRVQLKGDKKWPSTAFNCSSKCNIYLRYQVALRFKNVYNEILIIPWHTHTYIYIYLAVQMALTIIRSI